MEIIQEVSRPLNLSHAYNVRDLGGYINKNNCELMKGRILRSDSLHALDDEDVKKLLSYGEGVNCVIDLRSPYEIQKEPNVFALNNETMYHSIPLYDNVQSNEIQRDFPESLCSIYIRILEDSRKQIAQVLRIISKNTCGCTLFNCTAGKDRTGVIAMLILSLADVDERVIVSDYETSAKNMEPVFHIMKEQMKKKGYFMPEHLLGSDSAEMEKTFDYLNEKYGGASGYLATLDIEKEELDSLKRLLTNMNGDE